MSQHKHHGADRVVEGELPRAHAAMNITPMIDVLLVLLVIFMVTLPLNQRGLDIAVPPETTPSTPPHRIATSCSSTRATNGSRSTSRM